MTDRPEHSIGEICDNAIDDDLDGLIDLNDPDCDCQIIEPVSLIPNPSFEEMDCCPSGRSQMNCATGWIQASEPTTDFIHMCNWMGWADFPPPVPFPDGEGIMGFRDGRVSQNDGGPKRNWKEYAGACLLSPLLANTTYRFRFEVGFVSSQLSPAINISFFGTSDCENLPFGVGNDDFGCPTNGPGWVRLGSTTVSGGVGNKWVTTNIETTPEMDIAAIAIGPDCPEVISPVSIYYFFDNLVLADIRLFDFQIGEISHPCSQDFILAIPNEPGPTYQWYKEGVALVGETSAELSQMYGEGSYQVRILEGSLCRVTKAYVHEVPVLTENVSQIICKEDVLVFGDQLLNQTGQYVDTFKTINNCDSIVFLDLKVLGLLADTVSAKIFRGEKYKIGNKSIKDEGDHPLTFSSVLGCDSLVLLHLDYYQIYIPNVFSPNGDGHNDTFTVLGDEDLAYVRELLIYDRWDSPLFKGSEWDCRTNGAVAQTWCVSIFGQRGDE